MKTNIASALANGINMEGIQVMRRTFPDEHLVYVPVEKVAGIVSFVCSDDGDIINGACWTVDGGWTAN